jgi:hypothetical protein
MFNNFLFQKSCHLWDNVEICGGVRGATNDVTIRCIRFACWIRKATCTHAHTPKFAIFIAVPRQQCFANEPQFLVMRTLRVFFFLIEHDGLFSEASATRQTVYCCIFWAERLVATMTTICVGKCHNHSTYRNFESISGMYKADMPMLWESQLMQHVYTPHTITEFLVSHICMSFTSPVFLIVTTSYDNVSTKTISSDSLCFLYKHVYSLYNLVEALCLFRDAETTCYTQRPQCRRSHGEGGGFVTFLYQMDVKCRSCDAWIIKVLGFIYVLFDALKTRVIISLMYQHKVFSK